MVKQNRVTATLKLAKTNKKEVEKIEAKIKKKLEKKSESKKPEKPKFIFKTGKRKRAIARAKIENGSGIVEINKIPIDLVQNEIARLKMLEPLILIGDAWKKFDIKVNVKGGGVIGQAEAARQAIAKCLVEVLGKEVREKFMNYDRNLLVYDPRRTEPHKPSRSSQGPRRAKQKSKR